MSIYVPSRVIAVPHVTSEKAVLGQGAASMMTLAPLFGAIRNPQQMMRMAQMLFHTDRWVYKAEQTIDFAFSTVDWHLEDENDEEIQADATGPALDALNLIEKPQAALPQRQRMTRSQLWSLTSRHMGLCGSSFWLADQREMLAGTPKAALYINPVRMTPADDEQGNLTGWVLDAKNDYTGRTGIPLELDEVYHFKLNEPDTGHFGIGNVESALAATMLTKLSDQHAADVLASGGRLAGIVSAKAGGTIPDNVFTQMVRDFRTINDQPDSAKHMTVVQGPVEFSRTTASPAELDLLRLMTMAKEDTLAVWGVPLSQIGGVTPAGLNSGDVRKYDRAAMWQNAIHPRLSNFWEVLQFQLLDRYQDLGATVELELEEPEFDDDSPRYDLLAKSVSVAMRESERRALIGLDPLGPTALDIDGQPIDDAIYLPINAVKIGSAPTSGMPTSPSAEAVGRATPDTVEASTASAAAGETSGGTAKARLSPLRESLVKLRANVERATLQPVRKGVASFLTAQKREIAARVRSLPAHRLKDPAHLWPEKLRADWDARLTAAMRPSLATVASAVHEHITTNVPSRKAALPQEIAPDNAFVSQTLHRVLTRGAARVTRINETTREGIADIIAEGVSAGMSPAELGDAIEAWTGFDEYRAELIARTELADAYNAAALGSYGELGVSEVQAVDGEGDDECASRNGQTFSVDDAESITDHPNGTLDWVPILPGEA